MHYIKDTIYHLVAHVRIMKDWCRKISDFREAFANFFLALFHDIKSTLKCYFLHRRTYFCDLQCVTMTSIALNLLIWMQAKMHNKVTWFQIEPYIPDEFCINRWRQKFSDFVLSYLEMKLIFWAIVFLIHLEVYKTYKGIVVFIFHHNTLCSFLINKNVRRRTKNG